MKIPAVYREGLPALILSGFGLLGAGLVLGRMQSHLELVPSVLVLVPGIIAIRGNIQTALAARLGSAFHMGLIGQKDVWNDEVKQNVSAAIILSFAVGALVGVLAHLSSLLLGVPSAGFIELAFLGAAAGMTSGVLNAYITLFVTVLAFRRGYDPDNIVAPVLASFGDMLTMLILFGYLILLGVI